MARKQRKTDDEVTGFFDSLVEEKRRADVAVEEKRRADAVAEEKRRVDAVAEKKRRADAAVEAKRQADVAAKQADAERKRAKAEKRRADAKREWAEAKKQRADAEKQRAKVAKQLVEKQRADAKQQRAKVAWQLAESKKARAKRAKRHADTKRASTKAKKNKKAAGAATANAKAKKNGKATGATRTKVTKLGKVAKLGKDEIVREACRLAEVKPESEIGKIATLLLGALMLGPNVDKLARTFKMNRTWARQVVQRWRKNGIWGDKCIRDDPDASLLGPHGNIVFVLYVLCGEGKVRREREEG